MTDGGTLGTSTIDDTITTEIITSIATPQDRITSTSNLVTTSDVTTLTSQLMISPTNDCSSRDERVEMLDNSESYCFINLGELTYKRAHQACQDINFELPLPTSTRDSN